MQKGQKLGKKSVSGVNIGISWEGGKYLFEEGGLVFGTTYRPTVDKGQGKSRDGESDLGGGMGGGGWDEIVIGLQFSSNVVVWSAFII